MKPSAPFVATTNAPMGTRSKPIFSTLLLGIGATLLALFVELQLLRATGGWNAERAAAVRLGPMRSARARSGEVMDAKQPPLRVRGNSIDTGRHALPVDTRARPFE